MGAVAKVVTFEYIYIWGGATHLHRCPDRSGLRDALYAASWAGSRVGGGAAVHSVDCAPRRSCAPGHQDNAIDCHATEYATEDITTVIESLATKCATNTSIA